ncbi:DUF6030 family protein [Roseibium algae]|uniref:DUF6030 family protein n=1 Tax=Roseibium algae TaxID=3123038 RepID=A0ABU8TKC9_9HYPH
MTSGQKDETTDKLSRKAKGTAGPRPYLTWGDEQPTRRKQQVNFPAKRGKGGLPNASDWRRALLFGLPMVVLGFAGLVVARHYAEVQEPKQPQGTGLPDPLAGYSAELRKDLTSQALEVPGRLKLTFQGQPQELCDELAEVGLPNAGWRRAAFNGGRWQCASDVVPLTTPSVDYGPATLFFLLRGPSENQIDYLRLKLNVEDPRQMEHGEETVRSVIAALSDRYSWAVPERFLQAITQFKALEMTDRGVRLSVAPEDPELTGDPFAVRRLNIILNFGEPDLIRPADGFQR